jgi:hypothetical protein
VASRVQNGNTFEHMLVLHNPLYGGKIMTEYADDVYIYRTPHGLKEGGEERQLAKTQPIGEGVIPGFALVLEGSRCDNKQDAREEVVRAYG